MAFVLENLPAILLVIAVLLGLAARSAERMLGWVLLLPIGVTGLWAALYHLAFPRFAAAFIGWQPSPFQFEVGVADLAFGAVAVAAFWCGPGFRAAVVWIAAIALLGDAVGHVRQMVAAGNFAPGNAGVVFWTDLAIPALALALLAMAKPAPAAGRSARRSQ
jgi:hypothetical protein